ncbi:alpha/beta hydrolase family protein [Brevundimonas faecalis]|uniref:alpha/beta hydrolase family protein n=1 Tax=Brevundimonas faecalis TaxID=947378 RepID=UPI003610C355
MIRRVALASVLALSIAGVVAAPVLAQSTATTTAASTPSTATHVELPAPDGRTIDVSVWPAAEEKAVIVFSHGWNSDPARYHRIIDYWTADGFTVVAPLHLDSLKHPRHAEADERSVFITRIVDLVMTRGYVQASHPGKPLIAAGHSFGSFNSLMSAGAVSVAGSLRDPAVKAVVAVSTPGLVPGLVSPTTYATVSTPVLLVTGDADLVPGFVTNPRDHRAAFDTSPAGDKMLMTFAGGDHSLIGVADAADFELMAATTVDFMRAYALDDEAARARLNALTAPEGVTIERR